MKERRQEGRKERRNEEKEGREEGMRREWGGLEERR